MMVLKSLKILAYKQIKSSHITKLMINQSKIRIDKDQIVEEFACYYEKLYKPEVK